jgi:hypothetical protein
MNIHFCTPDDALVVRIILSCYIQFHSQFVKPPSVTPLLYFYNMFFFSIFVERNLVTLLNSICTHIFLQCFS